MSNVISIFEKMREKEKSEDKELITDLGDMFEAAIERNEKHKEKMKKMRAEYNNKTLREYKIKTRR